MIADETYLVATPYGMALVVKINGIIVGEGGRQSVFNRLLKAWDKRVGMDIRDHIMTVDA